MKGPSILVVDDEEGIRHGLENLFGKEGFAVHCAADADAAVAAAARYPLDAAVVDIRLRGGRTGIELLRELKRQEPDVVVIIITGFGSIDSVITAMKGGAADYLLKPIDNAKLLDAVRRGLELRSLARENRYLRDELSLRSVPHTFVTGDPAVRALLETADKVKDTAVTVLITGESGTGKEVLARYIHFTGARRTGEFISINCAALSESLLLSELFGHERGAFTGAVERKRGKFELANGGTLFLDEIGDMSLDTQAKLLRVVEEASFERVGGVKRISVDARIIAATNKDLAGLIRDGRFREDFFYRLNVVSLQISPLRERRGDIPLLLDHFLGKYSERYTRPLVSLSAEGRRALESWHWPGNVRELENTVNQIVLLGEESFMAPGRPGAPRAPQHAAGDGDGAPRAPQHAAGDGDGAPRAPQHAAGDGDGAPRAPQQAAGDGDGAQRAPQQAARDGDGAPRATQRAASDGAGLKDGLEEVARQYERRRISECLLRNDGNKSKTARELRITRKTLAQKIAKYGLSL